MQNTILSKAAESLVYSTWQNSPTFKALTPLQREQLASAYMRGCFEAARESIHESDNFDAVVRKMIEALGEENEADRQVLIKELGQLIINNAIEYCKPAIEEALEEAALDFAHDSGAFDADISENERMIAADNAQRARDLGAENIKHHYEF